MSLFNPTLRSSIGLKALAAVSGLFMTGWLVLHLLGNFTAFSGTAAMDTYAAALRRLGPLLWLVRGGLLVAFFVHVGATLTLAKRARMARPVRAEAGFHASSVASRAMAVGGPMLLVFVVYHLLHLTFGVVHPTFVPGHVYANLVSGVRPLVGVSLVSDRRRARRAPVVANIRSFAVSACQRAASGPSRLPHRARRFADDTSRSLGEGGDDA
jgi:hypothetical protein